MHACTLSTTGTCSLPACFAALTPPPCATCPAHACLCTCHLTLSPTAAPEEGGGGDAADLAAAAAPVATPVPPLYSSAFDPGTPAFGPYNSPSTPLYAPLAQPFVAAAVPHAAALALAAQPLEAVLAALASPEGGATAAAHVGALLANTLALLRPTEAWAHFQCKPPLAFLAGLQRLYAEGFARADCARALCGGVAPSTLEALCTALHDKLESCRRESSCPFPRSYTSESDHACATFSSAVLAAAAACGNPSREDTHAMARAQRSFMDATCAVAPAMAKLQRQAAELTSTALAAQAALQRAVAAGADLALAAGTMPLPWVSAGGALDGVRAGLQELGSRLSAVTAGMQAASSSVAGLATPSLTSPFVSSIQAMAPPPSPQLRDWSAAHLLCLHALRHCTHAPPVLGAAGAALPFAALLLPSLCLPAGAAPSLAAVWSPPPRTLLPTLRFNAYAGFLARHESALFCRTAAASRAAAAALAEACSPAPSALPPGETRIGILKAAHSQVWEALHECLLTLQRRGILGSADVDSGVVEAGAGEEGAAEMQQQQQQQPVWCMSRAVPLPSLWGEMQAAAAATVVGRHSHSAEDWCRALASAEMGAALGSSSSSSGDNSSAGPASAAITLSTSAPTPASPMSPRSAPDASFAAMLCQPPGFRPSPMHTYLLELLTLPDLLALRGVCRGASGLVAAAASPLLPALVANDAPLRLSRALAVFPCLQVLCLGGPATGQALAVLAAASGSSAGGSSGGVRCHAMQASSTPLSLTLRGSFSAADLLPLAHRLVALDASVDSSMPGAASLSDGDVVALAQAARPHRQLRQLRLSFNYKLRGEGWREGLAGCLARLREFRCNGCYSLQPGSLAAVLAAAPALQVLDVSECSLLGCEDFSGGVAGRMLRVVRAHGMRQPGMAGGGGGDDDDGAVAVPAPPPLPPSPFATPAAMAALLREVEVLALDGSDAVSAGVLALPMPRLRELSMDGCRLGWVEGGAQELPKETLLALQALRAGSPHLQHVSWCHAPPGVSAGQDGSPGAAGVALGADVQLDDEWHFNREQVRAGVGGLWAQLQESARSAAASAEAALSLAARRQLLHTGATLRPGSHAGQWMRSYPECTSPVLYLDRSGDGYGRSCEHGVSHKALHWTCCGQLMWNSQCTFSMRAASL